MKRFPVKMTAFVVLSFALIFGMQFMVGTGDAASTTAKKMSVLNTSNEITTAYARGNSYYASLQLVPDKTAASVVSSPAFVKVWTSNDGKTWTWYATKADTILQGVGNAFWFCDLGGAKAVKCQLITLEADSVTVTPWLLEVGND